jgi:hypothetical protein
MADPQELGGELEIATRLRLQAIPALVALVGPRIDWGFRPEPEVPALVLEIVSDPRPDHFKGAQGLRQTRVQVDAWAADRLTAKRVAQLAMNGLRPAAVIDLPAEGEPGWIEGLAPGVRFERSTAEGPELGTFPGATPNSIVHRARFDLLTWWALTEGA